MSAPSTAFPKTADEHFARGTALLQEGNLAEALASFDKAIALDTSHSKAYSNRGNVFVRLRRYEQALENYDKAVALDPANAMAHSNRGAMLQHLRRYDEALEAYTHAVAVDANHLDAYVNRGALLTDMRRFAEAEESLNAAIALKPDAVEAHWNKALLKLVQGEYAEGWKLYEWRWKKSPFKEQLRDYPQPLWLGEKSLNGKRLLIHAEQGFGDFIQCARYVPLLESMGARVILEVPASLAPLMETVSRKAQVIPKGDPLPEFDLHCPVMSLPLALRTTLNTIPNRMPYLFADEAHRSKWQQRLGPKTRLRVGLVWSGAMAHVNDHNRSMPLATLAPLWMLSAEFHGLQKEVRMEDAPRLHHLRLHAEAMQDFADTAALIEALDLVITVDTAVAHLAGALGKPVWVMLPYAPDFRWLLERQDSPWYPTARLFRQQAPGNWDEVIARVGAALAQEINMQQPATESHTQVIEEAFAQALAMQQAGQPAVAEEIYQEILKLDPHHLKTLINASSLYIDLTKYDQALMLLEQALAVDEAQPILHYNYGRILMHAKMPEEAARRYERAIALSPKTAVFYSNRGIALFALNRYEEAIANYTQAIERDPKSAEYYSNRGNAYAHLQRFDEAAVDYAQAVKLFPGMGDAHFNWALIDLMKGRFEEGWKRHEWRWEKPSFAADRKTLPQPLWLGQESLQGKTIYIYPEQGLGDVIQFSRYVPLLEAKGAKVILEVHVALVGLLSTISKTVTVLPKGAALPPFDFQCPVMSLPLALRTTLTTIPGKTPYLSVTPQKRAEWEARLGPKTKFRVGLAWSGSQTHVNDHNRSVSLAQLMPLFDLPVELHSMQKDVRDSDQPYMHHLISHAEALKDFTDTAALAEAMDIVISVDTSVAHLAGALNKPVWLMITAIPDFRWLLDREDSPWYPTARLFRQQEQGQWDEVVMRVKSALSVLPGSAS